MAVEKGGFAEVALRHDVPLDDFETTVFTEHPSPLFLKTIPLAKAVSEADGLVSISKLKTHGLTRFTGAVKTNMAAFRG